MTTRFRDRHEGGRLLARLLVDYAGRKDVLVLAIPSGGVPVAAAIAGEFGCAMDVWVVRTLTVPQHDPWQLEIVMGAVAPGGVRVVDVGILTSARVPPQELEQVVAFEQQEVERLQRHYRGDRPFPNLRGRTVILATDAIVIGSTMEAGIRAAQAKGAVRVVAATPVGLASACEDVQVMGDGVFSGALTSAPLCPGTMIPDTQQTTKYDPSSPRTYKMSMMPCRAAGAANLHDGSLGRMDVTSIRKVRLHPICRRPRRDPVVNNDAPYRARLSFADHTSSVHRFSMVRRHHTIGGLFGGLFHRHEAHGKH